MIVSRKPLLLAAVSFLAAACAGTNSAVRVDRGDADLAKCRSFDWLPTTSEAASFTEQRVRAAALEELQKKGYTLATENPDCRITYVLSSYEREKAKPRVGVGVGGGSGGLGGGIGVSLPVGRKKDQAGTFTLDVIDTARKAQIWSGALDASFSATELSEDEAREVVREVLAQFPDRVEPNR